MLQQFHFHMSVIFNFKKKNALNCLYTWPLKTFVCRLYETSVSGVLSECEADGSSLAFCHIRRPRCFVRCFVFSPRVSTGALFPSLGCVPGLPEDATTQGKKRGERLRPV